MSAPRALYEDDDLLVALKPAGLPTTAPGDGACLARWAEGRRGKAHPTSRLDAEVTGLVTFALSQRANEALRRARAEGRYGRGYLGLASAPVDPPEGEWTRSIAVDPRDRRRRVAVAPGARGQRLQAARTGYVVRARAARGAALWLTPYTGRTHQLRVHAADAGAPLFGDVHYGGPRRVALDDGRMVRAPRVMLHCAWLRLPAPGGGPDLELEAAAPEDLRRVWAALGGAEAALASRP